MEQTVITDVKTPMRVCDESLKYSGWLLKTAGSEKHDLWKWTVWLGTWEARKYSPTPYILRNRSRVSLISASYLLIPGIHFR